MKLGIYLFSCSHLSKETLEGIEGKKYNTINAGYILFREEDIEGIAMYKELLPFMDSINLQFDHLDQIIFKKDFNIPDDAIITGYYYDENEITFYFDSHIKITLSRAELKSKYIYYKLEKAFICSCKEIAYWKKGYAISDEFSKHHEVEDYGYYLICDDELEKFDELFSCFPHGIPEVQDPKNEAIFYHERY